MKHEIANDGGPAFPWQRIDLTYTGDQLVREQGPGMSLRDWFAGMALQGMLSNPQTSAIIKLSKEADLDAYTYAALGAYSLADAMLKEKNRL